MARYSEVEAGLEALLKKAESGGDLLFSAGAVSRGDYRIFANQYDAYVVITPGPIPRRQVIALPRYITQTYIAYLELFIPYVDDISQVWKDIRDKRDGLLDYLDQYPTLEDVSGVVNMFIGQVNEPRQMEGAGRRWWTQVLNCEVEVRDLVEVE